MNVGDLASKVGKLFAHLRPILREATKAASQTSLAATLAVRVPSMKGSEIYTWLNNLPGMREFVGERNIKNVSATGWEIYNKKWESTIEVSREDVERDSIGQYSVLAQEHGASCASQPDKVLIELLVNGFTNKCYTGKAFFGSNHQPVAKGNKFTNVTDAPLSREAFRAARTAMLSIKNEADDNWVAGTDLVLVVPPALESVAESIVAMKTLDGGAQNPDYQKARVEMVPRLAGNDTMWFLIENGRTIKAFAFQEEVPLEFNEITDPKSDHVFKNDSFLFGAYARNNLGYLFPQLAFGSTGDAE